MVGYRPMRQQDVTLGESALHWCTRLGISETDVKAARAGSISQYEGREYLIVTGELSDGTAIRLKCRFDRPGHVVSFRPVGA
jgi:hypothetical protein